MESFLRRLPCLAVAALAAVVAHAQNTVVKTNALYWATATPNLAIEQRLGGRWTAELSAGYNPFTFSGNKKLRHIAVQPEARYWLCQPYGGHFFGLHLIYSHFNAGGVKMPFGLFSGLADYRYQGDLGAAGVGYGYTWLLSRRWSLEAEVGVGVGYASYGKYECATCGSKVGSEHKTVLMPTKAAVSLVYCIK